MSQFAHEQAARGRWLGDHCKRGHPLTEDNIYVSPKGRRRCRACQREGNRERYSRDPKRGAAKRMTYYDTVKAYAYNKRWRSENREKKNAHSAVEYAVKTGKLARPNYCEACRKVGPVHGHHEDYSKPLEVEWLCVACHRAIHTYLKEAV